MKFIHAMSDYLITRVGYDTNGNWSYWIKHYKAKRSVKVQHTSIEDGNALPKVTPDVLKHRLYQGNQRLANTLDNLVQYYRKHHEK